MAHYLDKDGLQRFFNGLKNVFAAKNHTHTTVNGHTVESDVPANAKFTDTTYSTASQSAAGLMSAADKKAVDNVPKYYRGLQGGTAIAASTDLNTLTTPGNYYCSNSSIASSLTHSPTTTWFYMFVSLNDGYSTAWPSQEIVEGTTGKRYYRYKNGSNDWVAWTTLTTRVKGNAESSYRSGDVNLTAANIGAIKTDTDYINIHPENSPVIIPFIFNDIAYLLKRGGSAKIYYDGVEQSNVNLNNCFDGTASYVVWNPQTLGVSEIVIELTLHQTKTWTNVIYVDFGSYGWRAQNVKIEVMNQNYANDVWTQKLSVTGATGRQAGHQYVVMTHTPVGAANAGYGFNKIRFTFSNWGTATIFRIAQLGVYNYASQQLRETVIMRDGCDGIYGDLIPFTTNAHDLGSSSKKWANGYFTTLYGSGANLTSLNGSNISSGTVAAERIASLDASKIGSGTFDAARIPSLAAGKITSGTLDAARIPSLDASKIGSGTLAAARLPAMTGATASAAGTQGAVPAPAAGKQAQFLRGDGAWATPSNNKVNVTLATTTKAFLLGTSTTPKSSAQAVTALADTGVYLDTTAGRLTATSFAGNGLLLTNLDAGNLYAGTVPRERLPLASSTQAGAMSAGDKAKLDSIIVTGANSVYLFQFSFAQNTFDSQQSLLYQVEDDDVGFDSTWLPEIIVPPQAGTYRSYASSLKGPIKVTTQADNVLWFQSSYPLLSSLTLWVKLTKTYQSNITEQELSA